ncbi:HAD family hydrolase [Okibacterium endophyticum]
MSTQSLDITPASEPTSEPATGQAPSINRTWSCILFDLDGTITDSAPGIITRIQRTFDRLGRPAPAEDSLLAWVGPPMLESFETRAGMTPQEALDALGLYREISAQEGAWAGAAVNPGMAGVIRQVHAAGIPLAITSSKPESQVTEVLKHFDLHDYFTVVAGASEDETRSEKADVIEEGLRRLREQGIDLSRVVLVGDRHHDVEGAAVHGIPTIMVEWGYGSPAEAENAVAVVHSTDQLCKLLLG